MDLAARMNGKAVLVTGASSGLGAHFARLLAWSGAALAVGARRQDRLATLVDELHGLGAAKAVAVELDVTDERSVEAALTAARMALGPLDAIVNNAGIGGGGPALGTNAAAFDEVISTNLRGVFLVATAAARLWRDENRPGTVVNIASILGERVAGGVAPYAASKAGVLQLTKALALEWARHGVRVNALAPGYIETELNAAFFASEAGQALVKRIPMRRLGRPEDLDGPFLLLVSDAAPWMTGSTLTVDGGHLVSTL